jgi:hypothetical protein
LYQQPGDACYRALVRAPAIAAWIAVAFIALPATGDPVEVDRRVLLVAPPDRLLEATRAALAGWPIEVVVTESSQPGSTMPGSSARAHALAERHQVAAVVWIGADATGQALWMYDAASGRAASRRLNQVPPYDEPTAAAVALSVKTLLRHSEAVPAGERYGAGDPAGEHLQESLEVPAEPRPAEPVSLAAAPIPRLSPVLAIEASAGPRLRRTESGDVELRVGAGIRLTPPALAGRLATYLAVSGGPGMSVDQPGFLGEFRDLQLSTGARARFLATGQLAFGPLLGASLHLTEIDGALRRTGTRATASRRNPSIDGGAYLELDVGRGARVSATGELSGFLRHQVYRVGGEPVLSLPRVEAGLTLQLSVPLL